MNNTKVILEAGTGKTAEAKDIVIPDLWHIGMWLKDNGQEAAGEAVLETWHTAHALKKHILNN